VKLAPENRPLSAAPKNRPSCTPPMLNKTIIAIPAIVCYNILIMDRLIIAVLFILGSLLMLRAWPKSGFVRWLIAVSFVTAVVFLAIVSRQPGETARLNMEPFFALKRAIVINTGGSFPWVTVKSKILLMDIILNVLLFVPFGFIIPCLSKKLAHWWAAIPLGLLFSMCIEFTQYSAKLGTADVDDVINNTLGAAIGWLLYLAFLKKVRWSKPKRKRKKKSA